MSTDATTDQVAPAETAERQPTTVRFLAPVHVECPARPHGSEPAKFYIVEGVNPEVWACEGCAALVTLQLQSVEIEGPTEEATAAATASISRPPQRIGPRALLYDPLRQTFHVGGLDRLIQRIGAEVHAEPPNRERSLTTWGLATFPATRLSLEERLAVSAFMAGRWWAWAHQAEHDQVLPGPSRIVRPH